MRKRIPRPQIKVNPKLAVRSDLLEILQEHLYRNTKTYHFKLLSDLITKNSVLCFNARKSLSFGGNCYVIGGNQPHLRISPNLLHHSLRGEMREYLTKVEKSEQEIALVKGFFQKIMFLTNKEQDYCNLLPTVMHPAVRQLSPYLDKEEGHLSPEEVTAFLVENESYINLIKQRLILNLIDN